MLRVDARQLQAPPPDEVLRVTELALLAALPLTARAKRRARAPNAVAACRPQRARVRAWSDPGL